MPKHILIPLLLSLQVLGVLLAPSSSYAAEWPCSDPSRSVELGFHETYTADDEKSYVHSGVDLPATAGLQIVSPITGEVRYVGAVPSGDSKVNGQAANKTMNAVSIALTDGRAVTLMPLEAVSVQVGDQVQEGTPVGVLASTGDISSPGSHLHMGLKRGRRYYDPLTLFAAKAADESECSGEAAPAAAPDAAGSPASPQPQASGVGSSLEGESAQEASPLDVEAVQTAFESATSTKTAGQPAQTQRGAEAFSVSSGNVVWEPVQEEEPGVLAGLGLALAGLGQACADQALALGLAFKSLSQCTGIPVLVLYLAAALALVALVAAAIGLFVNYGLPFVDSLWRSANTPLFSRKGDGSMHKLFPALGDAFNDPGPLARRR